MDFNAIIKEIGRGARGARGLTPALARESFTALLNAEVSDVQLGAWWAAQRIKGETAEELHAFVQAMHDTVAWRVDREPGSRALIVLPCYNGARQLPNLTPLLAHAFIARGFDVLMQGVIADPSRVTTYSMCRALNLPITETKDDTERALASKHVAFLPIGAMHPKLAALLARRWQIGVRSAPHTVAKLLNPVNPANPACGTTMNAIQVVALTHGDYVDRMAEYLQTHCLQGLVFRGCEGEPVLHPKRNVSVLLFQNGTCDMRDWNGVETHDLPDTCGVETSANYIQSVIDQQRVMPPWIDALALLAQEVARRAQELAQPAPGVAQGMHSKIHDVENNITS